MYASEDPADASLQIAALGFIPVAIHFNFFPIINRIGPVASTEALTAASDQERSAEEKNESPLCNAMNPS